MKYKGYIIEFSSSPRGGFDYWPEGGIDCDYDGESWKSNVSQAKTREDAMEEIDELIGDYHEVRINKREPVKLGSFIEAVKFANFWNGVLLTPIVSP